MKYILTTTDNKKTNYSISYGELKGDKLYRILLKENDRILSENPYEIAYILLSIGNEFVEKNKNCLTKKILQYFKNENHSKWLYALTGGDSIWKNKKYNITWNEQKALKLWDEDFSSLLKDALTLYDLIIIFKYVSKFLTTVNVYEFSKI